MGFSLPARVTAVTVMLLLAAPVLALSAPAHAVTLAAGVTVSLPSSFANLSFASDPHF